MGLIIAEGDLGGHARSGSFERTFPYEIRDWSCGRGFSPVPGVVCLCRATAPPSPPVMARSQYCFSNRTTVRSRLRLSRRS